MSTDLDHKGLIERPDGSTIHYDKLPPHKQIEHDVVTSLCPQAWKFNADLTAFKKLALSEMYAAKKMMFDGASIKKGGDGGNLTLRSACGRMMVRVTVSKHTNFGPELETAKALIFEFMEEELAKGGSDFIRKIVEKVFQLNAKNRVDTGGILGLREHNFDDPRWLKAMDAISEAITRDTSTTYISFYQVDPHEPDKGKAEQRIPLDLAKV